MTIELYRDGSVRTGWFARMESYKSPRVVLALFLAIALSALAGCGEGDLPRGLAKQAIAIGDVPENLRNAAEKELPGVKLNEAWKNLDGTGKLHSYEIRGKRGSDGKISEVRISTDGKVLEKE